jgi:hypothetical protein
MGGQSFDFSNTPLTTDDIGPTLRGYGLHRETGIVVFLDALRMKGIWQRFEPRVVVRKWDNVISSFKYSLDKNSQILNTRPLS